MIIQRKPLYDHYKAMRTRRVRHQSGNPGAERKRRGAEAGSRGAGC